MDNSKRESSGPLYFLLSALGVLWLLSQSRTPKKKPKDSIAPNTESAEQDNGREAFSFPGAQSSPPPPATVKTCKCCHHKIPRWEIVLKWLTLAATIGAFAAAAFYAYVANTQLEANERPRVTLENRQDKGIVFFDPLAADNATTFLEFRLEYLLKNFGHSPAYIDIESQVVDQNYPHWIELQELVRKKCDSSESLVRSPKYPWPNVIVQEMNYGQVLQLKITDVMRKEGFAKPTIIGCIWYRSTTTGAIYKTPFAGQISMSTENSGPVRDWSPVKIPLGSVHDHPKPDTKVVDVLIMGGIT